LDGEAYKKFEFPYSQELVATNLDLDQSQLSMF